MSAISHTVSQNKYFFARGRYAHLISSISFFFQLPPVPPPPEELRQSRRNLAQIEPPIVAPLTPPPQSISSRQLSSDAQGILELIHMILVPAFKLSTIYSSSMVL